jgi:hypothetical protein
VIIRSDKIRFSERLPHLTKLGPKNPKFGKLGMRIPHLADRSALPIWAEFFFVQLYIQGVQEVQVWGDLRKAERLP